MDSGWINVESNASPEEAVLSWLALSGIVSAADIEQAQSIDKDARRPIPLILNQIGALTDDQLAKAYSEVSGCPISDIDPHALETEKSAFSTPFLKLVLALPLKDDEEMAVVNPFDNRLLQACEFTLGFTPNFKIIRSGDWLRAYQAYFDEGDQITIDSQADDSILAEIADQDRDAPIVRQVTTWLSEAADLGASDVHFEARKRSFDVHYRIDGKLQLVARQQKDLAAPIVSRIKVLSNLDLGERNKSQDGRSSVTVRGRRLDIRVSIIPTIEGESAVMRLLDKPDGLLDLKRLGFDASTVKSLKIIMQKRHGLFIVAGPTGSGKTTTLYACLEALKDQGLKILSIEDPVEYQFEHVNQVQVSDKAGRTFASALRSFLRHDPDVILVGEIRDRETAEVAVQAALSGHLVLATIHAIDTSRVKTRLVDMGIDGYKIDACLTASMAQRLVRRLCSNCKMRVPVSDTESHIFETNALPLPAHIYRADGCPDCRQEGYRGRIAIAEIDTGKNTRASMLRTALQLVSEGRISLLELTDLVA